MSTPTKPKPPPRTGSYKIPCNVCHWREDCQYLEYGMQLFPCECYRLDEEAIKERDLKAWAWDPIQDLINIRIPTGAAPHRCPVCNGTGLVPLGYYQTEPYITTTGISNESCRTCSGSGIVWPPGEKGGQG